MKKIIGLIVIMGIFALCLCGCSDGGKKDGSSITAVQSQVASDTASEIQSEAPSGTNESSKPQTTQNNSNASKVNSNVNSQNTSDVLVEKPLVDMDNLSASIIEKFTDEQLEWVHNNAEKFPENFGFSELSGCGRVIESASSRDDAIKNAKEEFTTSLYDVAKCEILSETDNYYVVYVKWVPKGEPNSKKFREEKAVCFKEKVFDVDDELSEGDVFSQDKNLIKNFFDYCYYSQYNKLGGYKVLYSEVTEEKNVVKYTVYFVGTVYGDKGVKDDVSLYKQVTVIEKDDNEFERQDKVTVKKIAVIGEGYDGDSGVAGE